MDSKDQKKTEIKEDKQTLEVKKITLNVRSSVKAGLMQCCTKTHHCAVGW